MYSSAPSNCTFNIFISFTYKKNINIPMEIISKDIIPTKNNISRYENHIQ